MIGMPSAFALGIFSGKFIFIFVFQKSLRAFLKHFFTVGNAAHLGPDRFLEGGALGGQRQIEFPARPGKIFVQLLLGFL